VSKGAVTSQWRRLDITPKRDDIQIYIITCYAMLSRAMTIAFLAGLLFWGRELKAQGQYQNFLYYTNGPGISISGYTGTVESSSLVVPSSINGLPVTIIDNWAFQGHTIGVASLPASVRNIGDGAFPNFLREVWFGGDAPSVGMDGLPIAGNSKVYHLPGTTGWGGLWLSGAQVILWDPVIETNDKGFGIEPGGFGFNISGTPDIPIAVETCTNLSAPVWVQVHICALTNGVVHFEDPGWTNYSRCFYRVQWPATRIWSGGQPWP
jgi:hypothetical protein